MSSHPDILEIDAVRRGEGTQVDADHVSACAECREALAHLGSLAGSLAQLRGPSPEVPPELDAAILWNARKRALHIRRRRWLRPAYGFAAAAVLLLALTSVLRLTPRQPGDRLEVARRAELAPRSAPVTATDVDGDGRVDILDAFALARAVETHTGGRDLNGDGVVDERDIEILAARAVSLGGA